MALSTTSIPCAPLGAYPHSEDWTVLESGLVYLYDSGFPEIGPSFVAVGMGLQCSWDMTLSWLRGGRLMATLLRCHGRRYASFRGSAVVR